MYYVLVLWKQMCLWQTSQTVSAERRIAWWSSRQLDRQPYVLRLRHGTTRWWRLAEPRCHWLVTSDMEMQQSIIRENFW